MKQKFLIVKLKRDKSLMVSVRIEGKLGEAGE